MKFRRPRYAFGFVFAALCALVPALPTFAAPQEAPPSATKPAPASGTLVEQGKFTLHKFEQPIGEETYQVTRDGDALLVKMDFKFTDRGSPVSLTAAFHSANDLTSASFEIKGMKAGKRADVILVDGNPLESIHNIRNVKYVITDGKMYDCAELWRSVGFKP